jgi:hypothetical protein
MLTFEKILLNSTENSIFGSVLKNAFSLLILSAVRILSVPTVYTLSLSPVFFFISFQTAGQGWAGQDLALFIGRAGLYCTQSSNVTEPFRLASMAGL